MFIDFIEKGRGGREEGEGRERDIDQPPPIHTPTRDQTRNPGMCPEQASNTPPSGVRDAAPSDRATGPGRQSLLSHTFMSSYYEQLVWRN